MTAESQELKQLVGVIVAGSTLTWDEAMAKIQEVQQELHGFVTPEGAASLLAHRMGIIKNGVRDLGKIGEEARPSPHENESRSTSLEKNKTGGSGMGLEFPVEEPKRLEEGKHTGVMVKLDLRDSGKFKYLDVYVKPDNCNFNIKVGYPPVVSTGSRFGKLLARFGAKIEVGTKVDAEATLLNKRCSFVTVDEEGRDGNVYSRIQHDSLKPIA